MKRFLIALPEEHPVYQWVEADRPDPDWNVVTEVELTQLKEPDYQGFMDACDLPPKGNGLFEKLLILDAMHPYRPFRVADALPYLIRGAKNPNDIDIRDLRTLNAIYQQYIHKEDDPTTLKLEDSNLLRETMREFGILMEFL